MIVSSNAVAAWTLVGNGQDVFVDLDTIQRNGSNLNVWVVTNFENDSNGVTRQVSMKKLKEVACQSGTSRVLDAIIHGEPMGKGEISVRRTKPGEAMNPGDWEIEDGFLLKMVCSRTDAGSASQ